jgi:RimJ/RimL family protein N-acetyltransferase
VVAVTEWALAEAGITRVWATCDVENVASARVLEKAGLIARGVFERAILRPNLAPIPRPSLLFETSRDEAAAG